MPARYDPGMQTVSSSDAGRLSVLVPLVETELPEDWLERCVGRRALSEIHDIWIAASETVPNALLARLERSGCRTQRSEAVRGARLRSVAAASAGEILLFLHVDTRLEEDGLRELRDRICDRRPWGAFRLRFENEREKRCLPLVSFGANLRSRVLGLPFGDQAPWCSRDAYERVDGHPSWNFLDDLELSLRLRRLARPTLLKARATTSARRYEKHGRLRSVLTNARILARFASGADAAELEALYRNPAAKSEAALSAERLRSTVHSHGGRS